MNLLKSKFFKNVCKGLGLLVFALILIAVSCDIVFKIFIYYDVISKAVTTVLLIYIVFWLLSKIFGLDFNNFLG